jgi:amidohydrolase
MKVDLMIKSIASEAYLLQEKLVEWRRILHSCPELQMENPETASFILRTLREIGITEIRSGIGGGTGIAAMIYGAKSGMTLGIRADTDGLPINEETGLTFASHNENMHACGHDAHVAMALGAAKLLFENRASLIGNIKLIFQPNEEYGYGAKQMVADGVLENPAVDAIIGQHTGGLFEGFRCGEVGYFPEQFGFFCSTINAHFIGISAHTSMQHKARDAIMMACYAVTQLQTVMSRERNVFSPATISIGTINGGRKNNIIADECFLTGTIRSSSREEQKLYEERTETIFRSVAESMGGSLEFSLPMKLRSTPIDSNMLRVFQRSASKILPPQNIREITKINTVGEDFSEYCDKIPAMFWFHCATFGDERDFPHHNAKFTINEDSLYIGAALLAQFALDWQG